MDEPSKRHQRTLESRLPPPLSGRRYDSIHYVPTLGRKSSVAAGGPTQLEPGRYFDSLDHDLDAGYGACHLGRAPGAQVMVAEILGWLSARARVFEWVVMPNHVHLVMTLPEAVSLSKLMQGLKSRSAIAINRALGRQGRLWQREYFDRELLGEKAIADACDYVRQNPVKAGLCLKGEDWEFSSAWQNHRRLD